MNLKDIEVGEAYILSSAKKSRVGCSAEFFNTLKNKPVTVLKKLNNYNNKNIIKIMGTIPEEDIVKFITFWCSPYDLREIKETDET